MSTSQIDEVFVSNTATNIISKPIQKLRPHDNNPMNDEIRIPTYDNLPPVPGMPHGCTWGIWDAIPDLPKYPPPSQLGTLNQLTPSKVLAARNEIQAGISVALNWRMDFPATPHSGRRKPCHRIFELQEGGWTGCDDEVEMNTQGGSQWDGFRHWAHQPTKLYYNGVKHEDITDPNAPLQNGIDQWSLRGGIIGRGILLDYYAWSTRNNPESTTSPPPFPTSAITISDLESVAAYQGTCLQRGDILLIRIGFVAWYNAASPSARTYHMSQGQWAGVQGSAESVRWFWDQGFAAVGGDACAFEKWPAEDEQFRLHDNLLALFGMPVGEMFDLERLAEACREQGRWSFLFMSAPLNFPGGVASPPNGICVL